MIDLHYYMENCLSNTQAEKLAKFFGKYKFDRLYQVESFFSDAKNLDWIEHDVIKAELKVIAYSFASSLRAIIPDSKKTVDLIQNSIDAATMFPNLGIGHSGNSKLFYCPKCGKKTAYIGNQGEGDVIICNRKNSCKYTSSFYKYYKTYVNTSGNISTYADFANVDIYDYEVHLTDTKPMPKLEQLQQPVQREEKVIEYVYFDENKPFSNIGNISNYLDLQSTLTNSQKVRLIYEFFFRIIEREYSKSGEKRRTPMWSYLISKRKIDINNTHIKDIGFLHLDEAPKLLECLVNNFSLEDLLLTRLVKEQEKFFFSHQEDIQKALGMLQMHFTASMLVEKGILHPVTSDKPLEFNYKGSTELIKLVAHTLGNDKVLPFGVCMHNEKIYSFSFQFLFNEKVEKSGLIFFKSQSLYGDTTDGFRIRPTHIKKGLESFKEIELSSHEIDALPFGLSYEALKNADTLFVDEGPIDFLSWGNEITINGKTQKVFGCGIAGVNRLLKKHITLFKGKKVFFLFDTDEAGLDGVLKLRELFIAQGIEVKVATWNPHFLFKNSGCLKFHKALKNHLMKVKSFNFNLKSFKDINEIKQEISSNENSLPFKTLGEFVGDYVTFI